MALGNHLKNRKFPFSDAQAGLRPAARQPVDCGYRNNSQTFLENSADSRQSYRYCREPADNSTRQPSPQKKVAIAAPAKHGTSTANPLSRICKMARRPHRQGEARRAILID
jgi:hypothetical protein